jgi:hypothetical protein
MPPAKIENPLPQGPVSPALGQVPDRQRFSGGAIFGHAEDKT